MDANRRRRLGINVTHLVGTIAQYKAHLLFCHPDRVLKWDFERLTKKSSKLHKSPHVNFLILYNLSCLYVGRAVSGCYHIVSALKTTRNRQTNKPEYCCRLTTTALTLEVVAQGKSDPSNVSNVFQIKYIRLKYICGLGVQVNSITVSCLLCS